MTSTPAWKPEGAESVAQWEPPPDPSWWFWTDDQVAALLADLDSEGEDQ